MLINIRWWNAPFRCPWCLSRDHLNAFGNWTDRIAQSATGAVIGHVWLMSVGGELNGLISTVVTGHVAFATIDAEVIIDDGHFLLSIIQFAI